MTNAELEIWRTQMNEHLERVSVLGGDYIRVMEYGEDAEFAKFKKENFDMAARMLDLSMRVQTVDALGRIEMRLGQISAKIEGV
jgi:hypothetical protein